VRFCCFFSQLGVTRCRSLNYFFYVAFAVSMASLAAYLVLVFAPTAAGSGIAEVKVILGGFGIRNFLSGQTLLIKVRPPSRFCSRHFCFIFFRLQSVGLVLATGSGLPLGKEGPFVHVSCCIANLCSQRFSKCVTGSLLLR
jgi:chloride channel 3/4/5